MDNKLFRQVNDELMFDLELHRFVNAGKDITLEWLWALIEFRSLSKEWEYDLRNR